MLLSPLGSSDWLPVQVQPEPKEPFGAIHGQIRERSGCEDRLIPHGRRKRQRSGSYCRHRSEDRDEVKINVDFRDEKKI